MPQRTVSRVVSVMQQSRGPGLQCVPSHEQESRWKTDHLAHLSRWVLRLQSDPQKPTQQPDPQAHIGERKVGDQHIIFRLFFKERFQFAARLPPAFLRGGLITADFLCPTQPKTQFAINVAQCWIRLGQYFLQATDNLCRPTLQDRLINLRFKGLDSVGTGRSGASSADACGRSP